MLHGTLLGAWVPHVPMLKDRLAAGPALFGLALLSLPFGAVIAMPIAGMLINRFGSARLTFVCGCLFCLMLLGPPHATQLAMLMSSGVLMGASIGSMDVAMNAHGLAVERALKKPTMSIFHGGFSVGAFIGTFTAAPLMQLAGASGQLLVISAACLVLVYVASRYFLPASVDQGLSGNSFALPTAATVGLGMLCFLALMIEGSILDWGAIFVRERFTVDAAYAALAFGTYQSGMAVARFSGDYLRLKVGAVKLVFASSLLAALGTLAGLFAPSAMMTSIAFVFAGLGIGNVAPILFAGGGRLEPDAPGRGIAAVTTLGYAGFLAAPPMIGVIAQATSLQIGLCTTVVAALIIAAFSGRAAVADKY